MDLIDRFATEVGEVGDGPVTVAGNSTRGGPVSDVRRVTAPSGIRTVEPEEMIVVCGAATAVDELDNALSQVGQRVSLPAGGTVGGALAVGRSGWRRMGDGAVRDALLRVRYVSAEGAVVTAGGQTVKNVSGFDLCRLLVGSRGTLGFLGEVTLRTRPRPAHEQWFASDDDPERLLTGLYRPASMLWDGTTTFVLLDGHPADVAAQAERFGLRDAEPPPVPTGRRRSLRPADIGSLTGDFVVEVGVGIVHQSAEVERSPIDPAVVELHRRIKHQFDPTGRLNPGVDVLDG